MTPQQIARGQEIANALKVVLQDHGKGADKLALLMLQVAHETGGFKSNLSKFNNMTGIKWNPKSKALVSGETDSGIKSPEGDNYAAYDTVHSWANRYYPIVTRGINPMEATTIDEFAQRLKKNGYYTATLTEYTNGLKSWLPTLKKHLTISTTAAVSAGVVVLALIVSLYLINK